MIAGTDHENDILALWHNGGNHYFFGVTIGHSQIHFSSNP